MISKLIKLLGGLYFLHRGLMGYIDPNSGGMLFQVLAVIFALLSTAVLFFSSRIRLFFSRTKRWIREHWADQHGAELDISESKDPEE